MFKCSLKIFNINLGHERVVLGGEDEVLGLVDKVADLVNLLPREAVKHLDRVHSQVRPAEKIRNYDDYLDLDKKKNNSFHLVLGPRTVMKQSPVTFMFTT